LSFRDQIDIIRAKNDSSADMSINIAIINYPDALKSAVYGLEEMFNLANQLCSEHGLEQRFNVSILQLDELAQAQAKSKQHAVILPPSIVGDFYLKPSDKLQNWLRQQHKQGSILCSACAGSFIIAATGLLTKREATTHWGLINDFSDLYPQVTLTPNKIVNNDGDIITAAGMMSWLDLGLELVAQFTSHAIMRQLGKILVVDTGRREQRFYQQFSPRLNHTDEVILACQQTIQRDYANPLKVTELASSANLTERTFLRRFSKATGLKPNEYIQRIRIQKACDLLESSQKTVELIASEVGYEDVSSCRRNFVRITGLSPSAFKQRFVATNKPSKQKPAKPDKKEKETNPV